MDLFWHRRDLRITDNVGLAARDGPILPVFVLDPDLLEYASPNRLAFLLEALSDLRSAYREQGGDLLVERGDPISVIPAVAAEFEVSTVRWNRDYSGIARERDSAVGETLDTTDIQHERHDDALLHEPGTILTNEGTTYSVFSYFWEKWRDREKPSPVSDRDPIASPEASAIPTLADLGFDTPAAALSGATHQDAIDRLDAFCDDPIYWYDEARDYPAREATSRLSPYLRFGLIGVRTVWQATEDAKSDASDDDARDAVTAFQRQLAWREFYVHALSSTPSMVCENVRSYDHSIDWRDDPEELRAWKEGNTGYPIVDAGMRQLLEEGWMHNRVRMIAASFLTKDLMIDWRTGYDHFRRHLVDHDPANDAGGWQWAASTGMDAQPYFRIFNPMTQGERYDPEAEYISTYVPDLDGVTASDIHRWPELDAARRTELAPVYPAPIVDHAERREAAIDMFERARGE
jgi:deoxyribodipyrimidine photo-lyase